jgi:hypothetical protein
LRGKALREILLCQKVPDPPGNVDFNFVQETNNPTFKTVRQRLGAHATEAMCTGCHKITDPIGLALEKFDTIGGHRATENGAKIDTTGELDGVAFGDAAGLGRALYANANLPACLVERLYTYGTGRKPVAGERAWLRKSLSAEFQKMGYRVPDLLRRIATSEEFYRVQPHSAGETKQTAAAFEPHGSGK